MDNLDTQTDNVKAQDGADDKVLEETTQSQTDVFTWKDKVGVDLANSPTLKKFDDSKEGLVKVAESYANLEKLLGHEKVPIPKDDKDTEGWARFSKAMGIPESAGGYKLPDVDLPQELQESLADKAQFAEFAHKYKLTPKQAEGLWRDYMDVGGKAYARKVQEYTDKVTATSNALRQEWGDSYGSKVELADMVISKFADDKTMADTITANLSKSPEGLKFLAKIGAQFAENKIGDFQYRTFSKSPVEAKAEIEKINADPNHPYWNPKATAAEHAAAVEYVQKLDEIIAKGKG